MGVLMTRDRIKKIAKGSLLVLLALIFLAAGVVAFVIKAAFLSGSPRPRIIRAVELGNQTNVARLIAQGTKVDTTDRAGRTALIVAAGLGRMNIVELLLEKGADVQARDNSEETALTLAQGIDIDEIERLLKAYGAEK